MKKFIFLIIVSVCFNNIAMEKEQQQSKKRRHEKCRKLNKNLQQYLGSRQEHQETSALKNSVGSQRESQGLAIPYQLPPKEAQTEFEIALINDSSVLAEEKLEKLRNTLERGANPNVFTECSTPLSWALIRKDLATVRLLLEFGASISKSDWITLFKVMDLSAFELLAEYFNFKIFAPLILKKVISIHQQTQPRTVEAQRSSQLIIWLLTHYHFAPGSESSHLLGDLFNTGIYTMPDFSTGLFKLKVPSLSQSLILGNIKETLEILKQYVIELDKELRQEDRKSIITKLNDAFNLAVATQSKITLRFFFQPLAFAYLTPETLYRAFLTAVKQGDMEALAMFDLTELSGSEWCSVFTTSLKISVALLSPDILSFILRLAYKMTQAQQIVPLDAAPIMQFHHNLFQNLRTSSRAERIRNILRRYLNPQQTAQLPFQPSSPEIRTAQIRSVPFLGSRYGF